MYRCITRYIVYYCVRMPWYELIWYLYITYNYITLTPTICCQGISLLHNTRRNPLYRLWLFQSSISQDHPRVLCAAHRCISPVAKAQWNSPARPRYGLPTIGLPSPPRILAGNSRIQITRSSHVAIRNPLEMEIFNGKIIYKNGGFWWIMVDVLKSHVWLPEGDP